MGRSWLSPDPPCLLGHLFPITVLSRTNALDTWDSTYFKHCRYDPRSSPYCPVFRIGDLVAMAGGDFEDLALLVSPLGAEFLQLRVRVSRPSTRGTEMCCVQGGAVAVRIHWDCNLDTRGSDCRPQYSFQLQERGYNFRYGPCCHSPGLLFLA